MHELKPKVRVLIVQLWGIGDVVMTLPVAIAVRHRHPDAEITWLVRSPGAAELLAIAGESRSDGSSRVVVADPGARLSFARSLLRLRRLRLQAAIIGTRQSRALAALTKRLAGVPVVLSDAPGWNAGGVRATEVTDPEHRVVSNLRIAAPIAGVNEALAPGIERGSLRSNGDLLRGELPEDALVIGVHTGGEPSVPQKRYPIDLWRDVLAELLEDQAHIVLFDGRDAGDDVRVLADMDPRVHVVAERSLAEVAVLISRCHVFVGGDTGLGHIAAALGVRTVTLAGPTQIASTRPYSPVNRVLRTDVELRCQPCYAGPLYGVCEHRSCMWTLGPERVVRAIRDQIEAATRGIGP